MHFSLLSRDGPIQRYAPILFIFFGLFRFTYYQVEYPFTGGDFVQDYIASFSLRDGGPIYGSHISSLASSLLGRSQHENFHPPFSAVLYIPFTYLSFGDAYLLFNLLGLFFYMVSAGLVSAYFHQNHRFFHWTLALATNSYPFVASIALGQASLLIASGIIFSWIFSTKGHQVISGSILAVVSLLKLFPMAFVFFVFALSGSRKLIMAFIAMVSLIGSFCLYYLGGDVFHQYISEIAPRNIQEWRGYPIALSLSSLVFSLLYVPQPGVGGWTQGIFDLPQLIPYATILVTFLVFAVSCWMVHTAMKEKDRDVAACVAMTAMILLSPISWQHILVVMLFPLSLLWTRWTSSDDRYRLWKFLACLLLLSWPDIEVARYLISEFKPHLIPAWGIAAIKAPLWGLLLVTWFVWRSRFSPRQGNALREKNEP